MICVRVESLTARQYRYLKFKKSSFLELGVGADWYSVEGQDCYWMKQQQAVLVICFELLRYWTDKTF
jgi:hypothetical protein